jgi:hypothetical protein
MNDDLLKYLNLKVMHPQAPCRFNCESKVKTTEGQGVEVCSLTRSTLGVKRCVGIGMGTKISDKQVNYSHNLGVLEQNPNVILFRNSQVGSPEIPKIETFATLEAHNFLCKPLIKVRSKAKL